MKCVTLLTISLLATGLLANSMIVPAKADSPLLLEAITGEGIEIPLLGKAVIDKPSIKSSQTADQRAAVLKAIAGGAGWKRFSRNSVVAPVSIDLDYLKDDAGTRMGHRVHLAFVVHASLETLKDKDLMKQMFSNDEKSEDAEAVESEKITDEDLSKLGINSDDTTSFASVEFPLLDKVLVRGVLQLQQQTEDDTIVLAIKADPRFGERNSWSPISDDGQTSPPDWRAYEGAGGYLSVTRLSETDGDGLSSACLIESRFVVYEPVDWFSGSNLLRSKLPLMLQESARSLRRKLK
ncbi:MAG: hypothetical protein WBD20_14720 [Pirellulaceae bacterium]